MGALKWENFAVAPYAGEQTTIIMMQIIKTPLGIITRRGLQLSLLSLLLTMLSLTWAMPGWSLPLNQPMLLGALAQGNAITDPNAILRYALPIDNPEVRRLQDSLEDISNHIRAKRWPAIKKDVRAANLTITLKEDKILAGVPADRQPEAETLLGSIKTDLTALTEAVEAKDKEQVISFRKSALTAIGDLEALMVTDFPFAIPEEFANLPQLKGRATVEMTTNKGPLTIVVDGYSAPINAGNFVDLVQRKFYDGLPFIRSEDFFVTQAGDPQGQKRALLTPKPKNTGPFPWKFWSREKRAPSMA